MALSILASMMALVGRAGTLLLVGAMLFGWATPASSVMLEKEDRFAPVAAADAARLREIRSIRWPNESFLEEMRFRVDDSSRAIDGRSTNFILIRVIDRCEDSRCPTFIFKETLAESALIGLRHLPSESVSGDVSVPACRFCTGSKRALVFTGSDGKGAVLVFSRYGLSD